MAAGMRGKLAGFWRRRRLYLWVPAFLPSLDGCHSSVDPHLGIGSHCLPSLPKHLPAKKLPPTSDFPITLCAVRFVHTKPFSLCLPLPFRLVARWLPSTLPNRRLIPAGRHGAGLGGWEEGGRPSPLPLCGLPIRHCLTCFFSVCRHTHAYCMREWQWAAEERQGRQGPHLSSLSFTL